MSKTSRGEMFTSFPMGKHLFKVESISFIQKEISTGENTTVSSKNLIILMEFG